MKLESLEFENNGFIPQKFTCDGEDINPGLIIEDIPEVTASFIGVSADTEVRSKIITSFIFKVIPP